VISADDFQAEMANSAVRIGPSKSAP
jgi:hypothetical protein